MEGPGLGSQCRNHSHGPYPPGFGRHGVCAHEKQLAKAREGLPLIEDSSNCDIVKATQYGIFERCKELVEAGYDVRQPDKENVSLLHWAAINNRLDLVKCCGRSVGWRFKFNSSSLGHQTRAFTYGHIITAVWCRPHSY